MSESHETLNAAIVNLGRKLTHLVIIGLAAFYAAEKLVAAGERDALASQHPRYFRDWFVELRREPEQLHALYAAVNTATISSNFHQRETTIIV